VSNVRTYVGTLAASSVQPPLVAFLTAPKDDGSLDVRAYMCDGIENGELFWVRGAALPAGDGYAFDVTSASGYNVKGAVTLSLISGTITNTESADPLPLEFTAPRASEGAGIYDLTASLEGAVSGKSLTGDTLSLATSGAASSAEAGETFAGAIVTADQQSVAVQLVDLSTVPAEDLADAGFSTGLATGQQGLQPATYRAILLMRDGNVVLFGRILLPGTGVNGIPPQFGGTRVAFGSRVAGKL
jgi:hypothetical protein